MGAVQAGSGPRPHSGGRGAGHQPRQWQVIRSLAEEFFSGEGARRGPRTIFAVGDEKQSIYSFQGAVPAYFDEMRRYFDKRAAQADQPFHPVELQLSFRSTPDVLGAVDRVFLPVEAHAGLSQEVKPRCMRRSAGIRDSLKSGRWKSRWKARSRKTGPCPSIIWAPARPCCGWPGALPPPCAGGWTKAPLGPAT
ncbi:UvrD-helicase domain-containing protein [Pannonibacter sp. Pt2-lr]